MVRVSVRFRVRVLGRERDANNNCIVRLVFACTHICVLVCAKAQRRDLHIDKLNSLAALEEEIIFEETYPEIVSTQMSIF